MMSQPKKCHYIAAMVVAGSFLQTTLGGEFEWATYLGGGGGDRLGHFNAVKVGPDGAVFVTGRTNSSDFPTTPGAYDSSFNGTWDVFVSKLSADGSTLLWSTYFGGLLTDRPYALSIDSQGRVVVAGETWSTDLPTTHDAYDTTHNGGNTVAWLAVFDPSETGDAQLVYSTFLGGAGTWDWIREIVCVAPDVFLIAGGTSSLDFPTTGGAYNTTYNGGDWDAFVAVLDIAAKDSQLAASTFLGAEGREAILHANQDASGAIIVSGYTTSEIFPTTSGVYQEFFGGETDAFAAWFDSTLSTLNYATYLGGPGLDNGNAMVLEPSGSIVLAGWAAPGFPVTKGVYDNTFNGGSAADPTDIYVARLSADLSDLTSTYVGGSGDEGANGISLDPGSGALTVTGSVSSIDFPTTPAAVQPDYNGGNWDSFVTRLDANLATVVYSTFVGGSGIESGHVIIDDGKRNLSVAGITDSTDWPATSGAYDEDYNGDKDTWVARVNVCPWDLDGDGVVGIVDFLNVLAAWGPNPGHPADIDGDGVVGITDFLGVLGNWGSCI